MTIKYKSLYLGVAVTALLTGCGDKVNDFPDTSDNNLSDITLQIAIDGVQSSTRSIIDGSEFPNDSVFTLYAMEWYTDQYINGGDNVRVTYSNSICQLDTPVVIPIKQFVDVYAFYPYVNYDVNEIEINATEQIDYLWGKAVNGYATTSNPKVNISFEHVMARITLRIRRDDDNNKSFEFTSISLGGDNEYTYRTAVVSAKNRTINDYGYGNYGDLYGEVSGNVVDDNSEMIIADFLVIPSKTNWDIHIESSNLPWWNPMPVENYESGKQYIYDVVIANVEDDSQEAVLQISECEITPWTNNDMPEVEIY